MDSRKPMPTIHDEGTEAEAEADSKPAAVTDEDGAESTSTTLSPGSSKVGFRARSASYDPSDLPNPESITIDVLNDHMYTAEDPPLELFVRTSGVERLSDFMLWQCHQDTHIEFVNCFWPDFDLQHFIWVILEWQWRQKQKGRDARSSRSPKASVGRLVE